MARHDIVPTYLAVTAMRDNGYKNAAYAIAELIDNAIQAGATEVELLCGDKTELRRQRRTTQIHSIGVLDNGSGMDDTILRMALQFGNGMYLNPENHTGIGRFGMGLPSSSISQCRRVDVWTWQNGLDSAIHSYLDLDEIIEGIIDEVPEPKLTPIPDIWLSLGKSFGQSGTLVVWSHIDRSMWRRSSTIIDKSEFIIGRIYRRFLASGTIRIRFLTFDVAKPQQISDQTEDFARPNDPLYLMSNTSAPPYPFPVVPGETIYIESGEPMFTEWGDPDLFHVQFNEGIHEVVVRYAIAKNEARKGDSPGAQPHGKHAMRNVGVSILRADRELDLDPAWSNPSEARDRWWGVEVEFPPALDDLFGVTNNKQSARYFSDLAKVNLEEMIKEGQTIGSARAEYEAEADPIWPLFEIAGVIQKNISSMQNYLRRQKEGSRRIRTRDNDDTDSPEAIATAKTKTRQEQGYVGESDRQEGLSEEERIQDIQETLLDQGEAETEEQAQELAAAIVGRGYKYEFRSTDLSGSPAFFDVQSRGGKILITLNTRHPAYDRLIEVLEDDVEGVDVEELRRRLIRAGQGLDLLLSAWARYEDEQRDGPLKRQVQDARWDWGRMARDFLEDED